MLNRLSLSVSTMLALVLSAVSYTQLYAGDPDPVEIFNQRILPIFRSEQPSSCVQCHLSSVDLKNYILPSAEATFAALRDQGLIDLAKPEESKILALIKMGEKDLDAGARLIHESMRKAEYDAFASWIKVCASDPKLKNLKPPTADTSVGPAVSVEVIRHTRKNRVVDSFTRLVWSQRMRCFPCHTPHEIDPSNPRHQAAIKTYKEFEKKLDAETMNRLGFFRKTPDETVRFLLERSQKATAGELPLINLDDPRRSLLVLKPMSKVPEKNSDGTFTAPSNVIPVSHLGGLKMHADDPAYKGFLTWLEDYARVAKGVYRTVDQLPADNWRSTEIFLKLENAPSAWEVGSPVQMFVYSWEKDDARWGDAPIAFTQGLVTPQKFVNAGLFLFRPDSPELDQDWSRGKPSLEAGRYLVKVYRDTRGRLAEDPSMLLDETDFQGQVELPRARWREGFLRAESFSATQLKVP